MPEDKTTDEAPATNVKPGFANVVTADNPTGASPQPANEPGIGQPGGTGPSASSVMGPHGSQEPNEPEPGQPGYRGLPAGAASNPGKSRKSDDDDDRKRK